MVLEDETAQQRAPQAGDLVRVWLRHSAMEGRMSAVQAPASFGPCVMLERNGGLTALYMAQVQRIELIEEGAGRVL